jgi:hypothetical protein
MLLGRIWSGVFEKKLSPIINRMRPNQAFLPPVRYRLYRNTTHSRHLSYGEHSALTKALETTLKVIRLSYISDHY